MLITLPDDAPRLVVEIKKEMSMIIDYEYGRLPQQIKDRCQQERHPKLSAMAVLDEDRECEVLSSIDNKENSREHDGCVMFFVPPGDQQKLLLP